MASKRIGLSRARPADVHQRDAYEHPDNVFDRPESLDGILHRSREVGERRMIGRS